MNIKSFAIVRPARVALVAWLALCLAGAAQAAPVIAASPLKSDATRGENEVTRLRFDARAYAALRAAGNEVRLTGFALGGGRTVELKLKRVEPFARDARIVAVGAGGEVALPRPDVVLLSGRVAGEPDSWAFLGLSPHGCNGLIRIAAATHVISAGRPGEPSAAMIYDAAAVPRDRPNLSGFTCFSDALPPHAIRPAPLAAPGAGAAASRGGPPCRNATVALDTDYEYTAALFGGSTSAATAYAATLLGAVSEIYKRDINVVLEIGYLRLWTDPADPWDQPDTISQLFQFQDHWNLLMTGVSRHAAHFLSGRPLGGGVAYYPGLCYPEYDYGLSANLGGYFPYPIENNHPQNWDLMVVAHELGHNFGAPHTHDMSPPVDCCGGAYSGSCGGQDCSVVPNGTIMSYCHLCGNGLADVRMEFHERTINEMMLPFLADEAMCNLVVPCVAPGDCDGDGELTAADVDCFAGVLLGLDADPGRIERCDMNESGTTDGQDIQEFVAALLGA